MSNDEVLKELETKTKDLESFCYSNKIPMFLLAVPKIEDKEKEVSVMVSYLMAGQEPTNDKIAKMVCILRGFEAVPPQEPLEIEL